MQEYRVVSDGINFRIQRVGKTFFTRRPKWYYVKAHTYAGSYIEDYKTESDAMIDIIDFKRVDKANKQGFLPLR